MLQAEGLDGMSLCSLLAFNDLFHGMRLKLATALHSITTSYQCNHWHHGLPIINFFLVACPIGAATMVHS